MTDTLFTDSAGFAVRNHLVTQNVIGANFPTAYTGGGFHDYKWRILIGGYLQQLWMKAFAPEIGDLLELITGWSGYGSKTYTSPVETVQLNLDTTHYAGDKTYSGLNFGKYGVLSFTASGYRFPVSWVNFPSSVIPAPHASVSGFDLTLAPGVTADVRVQGRYGAGDINYQDGGGSLHGVFNPYTGVYSDMQTLS